MEHNSEKKKANRLGKGLEAIAGFGKKAAKGIADTTTDIVAKANITENVDKAKKVGLKAAKGAQIATLDVAQKAMEEIEKANRKKAYPVFMYDYQVDNYNTPNMILIVDDVVAKKKSKFEGEIGWRRMVKGAEVFQLYDEEIQNVNIQFIPAAVCNGLYYVDHFDRNRFIRIENFFDKMQESRFAELQHIAYSLGAKKFRVEIVDIKKLAKSRKGSVKQKVSDGVNNATSTQSFESNMENRSKTQYSVQADFSGEMEPVRPTLRWFANDSNILNLIDMRLNSGTKNTLNKISLEIKGAEFTSMNSESAASVDAVAGKLIKGGSQLNFKKKVVEEQEHILIYQIEF